MNRDRKHLLGVILADSVVVEDLTDLLRGRNTVARFPQQGLVLLADDVQAKLDAFVANEDGRPGNELAHLVLARRKTSSRPSFSNRCRQFCSFRAALQDATVFVNFERRPFSSNRAYKILWKALKEVLQILPIEHKPHRASSRALAHLDGLLDEALERRATLSRSISSVNHTTLRSEFSIPALSSLATGRRARGPHRNTNACTPVLERLLITEQTNCCADACCNIWP
jgi:hypothetical protein